MANLLFKLRFLRFSPLGWKNGIIAGAVVAGLALPAFGQTQSTPLASATPDALARNQGFPGQVETVRRGQITATVEGTIKEIHFEAGQNVTAGDIVFTLDDRYFQLAVKNAQANFSRADQVLQAAKGEFIRTQKLLEKGSISNVQMLKSQVAVSLAEALLEQAQANLETEQTKLDRTVLYAPISGIIGRPQLEVGAYITPGFSPSLAKIVQMDPILVSYKIPYVARMEQLGIKQLEDLDSVLARVVLTLKLSETWVYDHKAIPKSASTSVDPATGEMTIWAEVPNPDQILRPGLRVTVLSNLDTKEE